MDIFWDSELWMKGFGCLEDLLSFGGLISLRRFDYSLENFCVSVALFVCEEFGFGPGLLRKSVLSSSLLNLKLWEAAVLFPATGLSSFPLNLGFSLSFGPDHRLYIKMDQPSDVLAVSATRRPGSDVP